MKIKYLILFIFWQFVFKWSNAQFDTAIHFNKYAFEEIFARSHETSKPIMLYFHIDGCGSCIQLERGAFSQKDIYTFINSNLIVYNINTQKGEGIAINKQYNIVINPTILFLNQLGKVTDRVEGYQGIYHVYGHLKRAVEKMNIYREAKIEYVKGNRKPDFLYAYTYILDEQGDLDSGAVVAEYLALLDNKELLSEKNIGYIYDFAFYNNVFYINHNSSAFKMMYHNKNAFARYFNMNQIDARIILTLYAEIQKSIKTGGKDFEELYDLIKIYHGKKNIGMEDTDQKKQVFMIHQIDSNMIRADFNRSQIKR
ncbi:MAG: thioredoxin family protein [Bacteroidota bacterium]|nr:thioredoxin family protein [Bacteroidota bacterium]